MWEKKIIQISQTVIIAFLAIFLAFAITQSGFHMMNARSTILFCGGFFIVSISIIIIFAVAIFEIIKIWRK